MMKNPYYMIAVEIILQIKSSDIPLQYLIWLDSIFGETRVLTGHAI